MNKRNTTLILLALTALIAAMLLAGCAVTPPVVPTEESQPAPEATVPATATAGGEATQLPATPADNLIGSWQWTRFSDPVNGPTDIDNSGNYLITFNDDGTVAVKADCNNAQGSYTAEDSSITIELGPTTLVACGDDSRSDDFLKYLGFAAIYHFEGDKLLLDLKADGGTMTFEPAAPAETSGGLSAEKAAALDGFLDQLVYSEGSDPEAAAPGVILLVDTPEGRYLKAVGVASLDEKTPLQPDALMEIGSNTKSFTIVLLLQLQEAGALSLDDPLSKWLPEWAEKIPYGDEMTLRQLANHTAGIWDYAGDDDVEGILSGAVHDRELLTKSYTPEELVQYAIDHGEPYFKPGEKGQWHYSNTGYILLGMIIEKVAGKPIDELYMERIFKPLNMQTAFMLNGVPGEGDLGSNGYYITKDEVVNTTDWNASQGWAAGALVMTADDLLTYTKALAAGELFQHPDTLQEMLTFVPDAMQGLMPYGLGILDYSLYGGVPNTWGHAGQTLGFGTFWSTTPDQGVTIIGFTNSATFTTYGFLSVLEILGLAQ